MRGLPSPMWIVWMQVAKDLRTLKPDYEKSPILRHIKRTRDFQPLYKFLDFKSFLLSFYFIECKKKEHLFENVNFHVINPKLCECFFSAWNSWWRDSGRNSMNFVQGQCWWMGVLKPSRILLLHFIRGPPHTNFAVFMPYLLYLLQEGFVLCVGILFPQLCQWLLFIWFLYCHQLCSLYWRKNLLCIYITLDLLSYLCFYLVSDILLLQPLMKLWFRNKYKMCYY